MKYQSTSHAKYYLKCHIIFVCKNRKKLLTGHLKDEMCTIFKGIESKSDFQIDVFESDIDHIHFLISYIPRLSITSIIRRLKQESTILIWQKYPDFLKQYFWREKTFWSDGYFVSSVGEASEKTIERYILSQG